MTVPSTTGQALPRPRVDQQSSATPTLKVRKLSWKFGSQQSPGGAKEASVSQESALEGGRVPTTVQDPAIRRSQSVSVPIGSNQKPRRNFTRSHSFKTPPPEVGNSQNSFKIFWGKEIAEGNRRSFKESLMKEPGDGSISYGETSENMGRTSGNCCKSFKAPADNAGRLKSRSFKSPPDTIGNSSKSFKEPRGNFRSQQSAEEAFNDVLFPLRTKQGL